MKSEPEKLLERHQALVHSQMKQVISHVQRKDGDWFINTLMMKDCDVPFRYKRKQLYRDLHGARVNLTYYPSSEVVAGMQVEIMKVVRIRRA